MMTTEEIVKRDMERRDAWRYICLRAYKSKNYKFALELMASNIEDNGDVESMIENFCSNADPMSQIDLDVDLMEVV